MSLYLALYYYVKSSHHSRFDTIPFLHRPILPLLKKDASGRTTVIIRPTVHNPSIVGQNDFMKLFSMVFDLAMEQDETINIYGLNVVTDFKHMRFGHILTPGNIKKTVHSFQVLDRNSTFEIYYQRAIQTVSVSVKLFDLSKNKQKI